MRYIIYCIVVFAIAACSTTKHVPEGQYLLKSAAVNIIDNGLISKSELEEYLIQKPNDNALGLWVYSWSGADTAKWFNRWVRKMGDAPVLYNPSNARQSATELEVALKNK